MQAPDPIETILARLMPPAMSQDGHSEIEAMLEELAGPETQSVVPISSDNGRKPWVAGLGIAAAVAGLLAVFPWGQTPPAQLAVVTPQVDPSGYVLVSESDRIESMQDVGWHEDSEGTAMQTLRLNAIEENQVRDVESGMIVQISEPREEFLYMPVSAF